MTWAVETGRSRLRRAWATAVSHRVTGRSGAVQRWWYQPGEVMPAPYPEVVASRECVHGTQVRTTRRRARPRSTLASGAAGGRGEVSAGACQAPQTTATRWCPSRRQARIRWRIHASRRSSCGSAPGSWSSRSARHRLGQGGERGRAVEPRLHHVVPPALGVVVPGGGGQRGQRIDPYGGPPAPPCCLGQGGRGRQVAEAHVHPGRQRPRHRLPLGGEHRERPERRRAGVVDRVGQQRHRRVHPAGARQGQQRVGVRGALDEHGVGVEVPERAHQRPGRARAVVPHPEDLDGHPGARSPGTVTPVTWPRRGRRRRTPTSPRARGPPPRGTRSRPPGRPPGP